MAVGFRESAFPRLSESSILTASYVVAEAYQNARVASDGRLQFISVDLVLELQRRGHSIGEAEHAIIDLVGRGLLVPNWPSWGGVIGAEHRQPQKQPAIQLVPVQSGVVLTATDQLFAWYREGRSDRESSRPRSAASKPRAGSEADKIIKCYNRGTTDRQAIADATLRR